MSPPHPPTNCYHAPAGEEVKLPKLEVKKDPKGFVTVQGATSIEALSAAQLTAVIEKGVGERTVSATRMNHESSRSHLVISIVVEATNLQTQAREGVVAWQGTWHSGVQQRGWRVVTQGCD